MKKTGILNGALMQGITSLGHYDKLVICDMGFPVPPGARLVDIALVKGIPSFMDVLKAVLNEAIFDEYWVVDSITQYNPECSAELERMMPRHRRKEVGFDVLQEAAQTAKIVIRTAEPLPASNIVLISSSGVPSLCEPFDIVIPMF